jgi:hypothetical protein
MGQHGKPAGAAQWTTPRNVLQQVAPMRLGVLVFHVANKRPEYDAVIQNQTHGDPNERSAPSRTNPL